VRRGLRSVVEEMGVELGAGGVEGGGSIRRGMVEGVGVGWVSVGGGVGAGDGTVAWVGRGGLVAGLADSVVEEGGPGVEVEDGEGGISRSGSLTGP
jgi:hypothetical protein